MVPNIFWSPLIISPSGSGHSIDAEASTCMRALYDAFFSRVGLPRRLHSEQGTNFESPLVSKLCSITGINKARTNHFRPHSDGQTEQTDRTILHMLRPSIVVDPDKWPAKLPALLAHIACHLILRWHAIFGIWCQSQHGDVRPEDPSSSVPHCQTTGEARRSFNSFCARFPSKFAGIAFVRSPPDQPRCENSKDVFRSKQQGPAVYHISFCVALLATTLMRCRHRKFLRSRTGP